MGRQRASSAPSVTVSAQTTKKVIAREGIDVVTGAARFLDEYPIDASGQRISAKSFLITTGARPSIPVVDGLSEVRYLTYEQLFDNDILPATMIVVGGGPIGMEMAQAYQRLGSHVTVIAEQLLPKEEPEVREVMQRVFERGWLRSRRVTPAKCDNAVCLSQAASFRLRSQNTPSVDTDTRL